MIERRRTRCVKLVKHLWGTSCLDLWLTLLECSWRAEDRYVFNATKLLSSLGVDAREKTGRPSPTFELRL